MTTVSTIKYNLDQLDHFRSTAAGEAGAFGGLGDTVDLAPAPALFGQNRGASEIAAAVLAVCGHFQREFHRAEELLQDVSRSIDAVQAAIEEADRSGKRSLTTTTPQSTGSTTTSSSGASGSSGAGSTAPAADPNAGTAPPVKFGTGVKVDLPDGLGTVEAPNAKAAGAVREALTQLGVPYVWGGESPGKGFDCSGLTAWAYGQEGVNLPHYAADQDIGARVSEQNLAPGDLVVWDGHVAMYIGDGKMIEAPHTGDVVHIVPLRTDNAGDAFEGFFRPTT